MIIQHNMEVQTHKRQYKINVGEKAEQSKNFHPVIG